MKATIYIISILLVLFSNELAAQKKFQKRKYTKGIFCETIKKIKQGKNQEAKVEIVQLQKEGELTNTQNPIVDTTSKDASAINMIELPMETISGEEDLGLNVTNISQAKITSEISRQKSDKASALTASTSKDLVAFKNTRVVKQVVLKSNVSNVPDESFFSFVFGDFWKNLGIVLLVIAGIALVGGLLLFVLTVNAPWLYISLGVIALGSIIYLIIDNSPKKDTESGEKVLAFLEKVGTPILALLCGLATAMTRI